MKFLAILLFGVGIPWLLFKLASWILIPFFGITSHPVIAALAFACIPAAISIAIAVFISSGAKLPDN